MAAVKTAISLRETLFDKLDQLAKELEISRSRLMALALEEFIERHENLKLLEALNAAYADDDQKEETGLAAKHKAGHRELLEGSW